MDLTKDDYSYIRGTSFKYARKAEDAEDICQLSLIKCFKAKFKGNSKRTTYLHIVVKNTAYNFYRNKKNHASLDVVEDIPYSEKYDDRLYLQNLFLTIERLPEKQKQCIKYICAGYTYKDISDELNISYDSARNNYYLAVKKIKNWRKRDRSFGTKRL